MPPFGPISRRVLVRSLKKAGWQGPYTGGKHQYMVREHLRLVIPNPHQSDISVALLNKILQQAGLSREEWEAL